MTIYLNYYFWLIVVSISLFLLERIVPWRKGQKLFREGFEQDLVWMAFNTQIFAWMIAKLAVFTLLWFNGLFTGSGLDSPDSIALLANMPLWGQFLVFLFLKDFIEWNIHRMMHVVPWMWRFHKLHHSIKELDWLGAFRFHWSETIIYKTIAYLPLVILGVDEGVIFIIVVVHLVIQEFIHSNIRFSLGPLKYLINTSQFHAWHHDLALHGRGGQNFAVNLTLWDWLFGTSYWPADNEQPERYGFKGMKTFPKTFVGQFIEPFVKLKRWSAEVSDTENQKPR